MASKEHQIEEVLLELQVSKTHLEKELGADIHDEVQQEVIQKIFYEKISNYFYQRHRDWPLQKLLAAIEIFERTKTKPVEPTLPADVVDPNPQKKRGKPPRSQMQ